MNKDELIDAGFQMIADRFSELDGYEEIYREATRSSLNTQTDLLTFTFDSDTPYNVNIAYNLYYENSIYSTILTTSPDLIEDYSRTISDFDNSLKPVEIISDTTTVQKVQETLNQKGYDAGVADGIFGPNTEAAIKNYQKAFNLLETGKITNKLLESLSIQSERADDYVAAGLPNSKIQTEVQTEPPVETPVESPIGKTVWIPNTGSKYHSKASCSNMKNPSQVSIEDAQAMGYTPCKKCY